MKIFKLEFKLFYFVILSQFFLFITTSSLRSYEHEIIRQHQQNKIPYQQEQQQEQQQIVLDSPSSVTARLGESVVFKCKFKSLKGEPQWCLDDFCLGITKDLTLKGRSRHRIIGNQANGEYHLQIDSVQLQDNMFYYCMATAASEVVKAIKSAKAALTVITYPQSLHLESPIHVSLNKPTVIQCVAFRSRPPVRILLSIDGQLISDETKYSIELQEMPIKNNFEKAELADIKYLQFNDQIKYFYYNTIVNITIDNINMNLQGKLIECNAYEMQITDNPFKMKNLKDIFKQKAIMNTRSTIQVDYAPEINLKIVSGNDQLKENDIISLVCSTKASPSVHTYKWYIGKELLNGANSDILNLKLRKEMNGESVSCEATNPIASVRTSLQLNVNFKPYFLKGSHSYLLIDKESCNKPITLDCQLESNPYSNITWYKLNYNLQDNKFNKIKIGYGPVYTNAALNCGNLIVYKFNESFAIDSSKLMNQNDNYQMTNDINSDFGLYICEANNGFSDDNKHKSVQRYIKLNPLNTPAVRLVVDKNEDSYEDETTTFHQFTTYAAIDSTITLTCIIDPLPDYKGIIWLRDNNKYLFDTKFIVKNDNELLLSDVGKNKIIDESSEVIDENYLLDQELEQEENLFKNLTYKVNTENTKDGLKSYLHLKIKNKNDFGLYKCKVWNIYGSKEVSVNIREEKYNKSLKNLFRIYEKYPLYAILLLCLASTIMILIVSSIAVCIFKRDSKYPCCTYNCKKGSFNKKSYSNSAIGIGVTTESSNSSTNGGVGGVHTGVHSTSSSHMSSNGFNENSSNDSKAIDDWLTGTSKLSNNTTVTALSAINNHHQQLNNNQFQHQNCLVVSYNDNNNNNNKNHESELLLKKSTPLTVIKTYKEANNNDCCDDSDASLNKLLSETTYRLSDLFKDLSPSLIQNSNNNNFSENTLKRYKTALNTTNKFLQPTTSSTSITTVTTNLSNQTLTTPSKMLNSKSPRLKKTSLATFLPVPPPPPTPCYQTTIHSNMKNIPYTTLSKTYTPNNNFYRNKNLLNDSINNDDDNENFNHINNDSFNEYSKLNDNSFNNNNNNNNSNNNTGNTFQTIV